jgi:predicted DnaQ family exonuclease/DinG family helicase
VAVAAAAEESTGIALNAIALACASSGQFAALTPDGQHATDAEALRGLTRGAVLITDCPSRARTVLGDGGVLHGAEVWDVLELAGVVLPRCRTDTLDHVGVYLGVEPPDDDGLPARAKLIADTFHALVEQIEACGLTTLLALNRLASGLDWPLRSLFRALESARPRSQLDAALATAAPIGGWVAQSAIPKRPKQPAPEQAPPLDLDELASLFAVNSPLARALVGYEPRNEQVRMAQLVGNTLNTGGQLLVEAGTGTGKGLAYLLPAALRALHGKQRVVVSTATTNLQDQLFEHDLPLVAAALGPQAELRASVLKGRGNYLCLRRWQQLLQSIDLSTEERTLLIKTLFWLPRTETGDRAELRLTPSEEEAWQRVCAITEACTPTRCPYHRIGVCFLARARRTAEDSHVIITNHALLLSDLVTRSRVLPEYEVLILDEAHHLEDEATAQLGWQVGERELTSRLEVLWTPGHTATGLVPQALALIMTASGMHMPPELADALGEGEHAVVQCGLEVRAVFAAFVRVLAEAETKGESTLRINGAIRASSTWQEIERMCTDICEHAQAVERVVAAVVDHLRDVPPALERAKELSAELAGHIEYWREMRRRLTRALQMPPPEALYWLSTSGRQRAPVINAAPLEVGTVLRERLFSVPHASVLVSATLAIDGSFDYVKERLGMPDGDCAALGSPFDYQRAALLYVPNDLPDPTQPGYQPLIERAILDVVTRLRGRALVLFTSWAHLRATYQALREPLLAQHITVLGQGIDESSRTRLLDAFRYGSRIVLFGTSAFWEGIDVVGDALSCVIVARLPFSVPTDPIYSARAETFEEPFMHYAVPQAVLRLKQGFGRLIRSRADRGAVVVLDRRLVTRYYGQVFVRSLPPCQVRQGPTQRAGAEVSDWLAKTAQQLTF